MHLLASVYDPLGLINPIVVTMKMFFQKLCIEKLEWDDILPDKYLKEWHDLLENLSTSSDLVFDRLYCFKDENDPFQSVQLHGFSDASCGAYGCCVYLRFRYLSGKVKTILVTSKSRVKPLSDVSIPRLELLGALLLARLMLTVKEELSCFGY